MTATFAILIPVNRLDRAKGRLASLLTAEERVALALATFTTAVAAARATGATVYVLTNDSRIGATPGVTVLGEDASLHGLNAQLEAAIARIDAPAGGLLILHADLPLATTEAIEAVRTGAPPAPSATLVRSADGGTNAMLLRPPGLFPLAYGAGSHALHTAAAKAAGMAVHTIESPPLALDLDTPDDLHALLATPGGVATAAGKVVSAALARAETT